MIGELDLYGIFVSPLLGLALLALLVSYPLRRGLERLGFYRWAWHRPLVDAALYVIVLGALWALGNRVFA